MKHTKPNCQQLRKDVKEFTSDIKNISNNLSQIKRNSSADIKHLKNQITIRKKLLKKCK